MKKLYLFIFLIAVGLLQNQSVNAHSTKLTKNKTTTALLAQTITFPAIPAKTFGVADFAPGATASSGLTVTYSSSNTAVATITAGGLIHIVGAGSVNIKADQAGNAVYSAAASVTQALVVNKATPNITFTALPTPPMGTADFAPGATSTNGVTAVTYISSNIAVATIIAGKIHLVGVGTSTITASQAADANNNAAANQIQTLTVTTGTPIITFNSSASQNYGVADYIPASSANTNPANPITYTSDNQNVAQIVSGKIHIVGVGTANITAVQPADANFNAAANVIQALTVNNPTISITAFPVLGLAFTTTDLAPTVITSNPTSPVILSSDNSAVVTIVNGKIHFVGIGTANITASQAAGLGSTYPVISSTPQQIKVISAVAPTLTLAAITNNLQSTDLAPVATSTVSTAVFPITYSSDNPAVATIVNNRIHFIATGTSNITATQSGISQNGTTTPTTVFPTVTKQVLLTVTPPTLTFATALGGKTLLTADFDPAASSPWLGQITYSSNNPAVATIVSNGTSNNTRIHIVGVGAAGATIITDTLYYPIASTPGTPGKVNSTNATLSVVALPALAFPVTLTSTAANRPFSNIDLAPAAINGNPTLPIIYSSSNPLVATIVNNQIHFVGQGVTNIGASQGGGIAGTATIPADATLLPLTVTAPVITFGPLGSKAYTATDLNPGATSTIATTDKNGSYTPITYTSDNPNAAIIVNSNIRFIGAGTANIKASQQNSNATTIAPATATLPADVVVQLIVTGSPVINFPALGTKVFNTPDINAGATSSLLGVPITYTTSDATIATIVNGNQIHFVSAGTVTIKASQQNSNATTIAPATATLPADVSQTLTITTTPTITFTPLGVKAFSTTDFNPGATANAPGAITYISYNPAVATIVNNMVHYVGILQGVPANRDTATIVAVLNNPNFYATAASLLTVTAPTLSITAASLPNRVGYVADFAPLVVTTLPTIPVTFTSSDPEVATIVNGNVHLVGPGTTQITASQAAAIPAGSPFPAPADATQSFTVSIQTPVITFAALGTKAFSTVDLAPGATSTSPLPIITYTSSNPAVATILNNQIHFTGAGTTVITASQDVAPGFLPPFNVPQLLTVTPPTITFASLGGVKAINSTDLVIPVNVTTGNIISTSLPTAIFPVVFTTSDPTIATVVNGAIHFVAPGAVVITASQPTTGTVPAPVPVSQTLTVIPAVMTFAPLGNKPLSNAGDVIPIINTTSTAPVVLTTSDPTIAKIVINIINGVATPSIRTIGLGTAIITASQGGGAAGTATLPPDVSQSITVIPTILTFNPLGSVPFNTNDLAPGASSSIGVLADGVTAVPITYTSSDPTVATIINGNIHFIGLGTTVITASQGGGATGSGILPPDVSQPITVTSPQLSFGFIVNKILTALGSKAFQTTDLGFTVASTVNSSGAAAAPTLSTAVSPIIFTSSNPNVATIVNGNIHFVGAGTTTINATQAQVNNSGAPVAGQLTLSQVLTVIQPLLTFPTLTAPTTAYKTVTFSGSDQNPGVTSTIPVALYPIVYTSSNTNVADINPVTGLVRLKSNGFTTISASQPVPAGSLYPGPATVYQNWSVVNGFAFPTTFSVPYGTADFSPGGVTSSAGLPVTFTIPTSTVATTVSGGVAASPGSQVRALLPGTAVITATQAGDASNLPATANTTLTVTTANLTITPKNITLNYGQEMPIPYPVTYTGFTSIFGSGTAVDDSTKFSAQPVYASSAIVNGTTTKTPPGTYPVTVGGAASALYNFTYGTGTYTIAPAPQVLVFASFSGPKHLGDLDFDPLARSGGDPVVYTTSDPTIATIVNGMVHIVGVGTVNITASLSTTSGNYVNSGPTSLTRPLLVAAGPQQILQVDPITQAIRVPVMPALIKGRPNYAVNAQTFSTTTLPGGVLQPTGLPVQIVSADSTIVKVIGQTLQPVHIGITSVTLKQVGNNSYGAAPDVVVYIQVIDPSGSPISVHQALSPNGDGVNDFLLLEGLQDYPTNHVVIVNRNGAKVFETANYNNKDNVFTGKSSSGGGYLPAGTYYYLIDYNIGSSKTKLTGYFVLKY